MATLRKLIHDFRWWLVKKLNIAVWALTPELERSDLRQIWRTQFEDFKKKNDGADATEMVAHHAVEMAKQQNIELSAAEARDIYNRQRNVIRWPK